jgi:hypothetical protein
MNLDDRFTVRVPLASEQYYRMFELFRSSTPVAWPGRDPAVGYLVESIDERSDSAWVLVTVARAGRL